MFQPGGSSDSLQSLLGRACRAALIGITLSALGAPLAFGRPATPAPPLPPPTNTVVNVSTEAQLQAAVRDIRSGTTIVVAPGTYTLTSSLYFSGTMIDVGIRGATNNRDDVVLAGPGMAQASYGSTPYGIWSGGNVTGLTIANLTLRGFYFHPIIFNGGTHSPRVHNVHLIDAGEQFIKSNPDAAGRGVESGIVEYSVIEYSTTSRDYYTNGIDVHAGTGWIIRHNLFRNLVAPGGALTGPAVLMWNHSRDTVTEGNVFLNCNRGISYGLLERVDNDHVGGVIRNNFFYRARSQPGDVGIHLASSPNTQVLNNTVFVSGTYGTPIEYRFRQTTGVVLANNLLDGVIWARDGATGREVTNRAGAGAELFVNAASGDLHLAATASSAIDRGTTTSEVIEDWDGEVRPHGSGYDIGADELGASAASFQIGGRIRDATTEAGIAGVTVTLSGARFAVTTTDATGAYVFARLAGDVSYVVTPSPEGSGFEPVDLFYPDLSADKTTADFVGRPAAAAEPRGGSTVQVSVKPETRNPKPET